MPHMLIFPGAKHQIPYLEAEETCVRWVSNHDAHLQVLEPQDPIAALMTFPVN